MQFELQVERLIASELGSTWIRASRHSPSRKEKLSQHQESAESPRTNPETFSLITQDESLVIRAYRTHLPDNPNPRNPSHVDFLLLPFLNLSFRTMALGPKP